MQKMDELIKMQMGAEVGADSRKPCIIWEYVWVPPSEYN